MHVITRVRTQCITEKWLHTFGLYVWSLRYNQARTFGKVGVSPAQGERVTRFENGARRIIATVSLSGEGKRRENGAGKGDVDSALANEAL